jgi:nitrous oxidase accessory protein NosD
MAQLFKPFPASLDLLPGLVVFIPPHIRLRVHSRRKFKSKEKTMNARIAAIQHLRRTPFTAIPLLLVIIIALFIGVVPARAASTIYVRTDGSDALCNGTVNASAASAPNCAKQTIAEGIATVDPGGVVMIREGTFSGNLIVAKDVTLRGVNSASTTIQGSGSDRVIRISAGYTVTIQHVTITGGNQTGYTSGGGGGIRNSGNLTLSHSVVTGNYGEPKGGGLSNDSSATLEVFRCTIAGNSTYHAGETGLGGGGIYNSGTLTVSETTISENTADDGTSKQDRGGGVFNHDGVMLLERVTINGNSATGVGGGVNSNLSSGSTTLINVTIYDNTADGGAGLALSGGASGGTTTINNSTIVGNTATTTYGTKAALLVYAPLSISNTLIDDNTTYDCSGEPGTYVTSGGYNLTHWTNCGLTATGDQQGADADLGPLQDNGGWTDTIALLPGSPGIDEGNPATPGSGGSACAAEDQRDWIRPIDGDDDSTARCDIGAYEAPSRLFLPLILR